MNKLKLKKSDIIILAAVLCIAAITFLCVNVFSADGDVATVQVNGKTVTQMPLDTNASYNVVIDNVHTNTVVVKNGKVSVSYANCPDKICKNHKAVYKNNDSIVCLPNKVVVTVQSSDTDVDEVAQ